MSRPKATIAPALTAWVISTCATTQNAMVPLSSLVRYEPRPGPEFTMRYNLYRSAQIFGSAAPGYSSQQATQALEETFAQDHASRDGLRLHGHVVPGKESRAGRSLLGDLRFSLLFVFLILAALYESWSLPFSVLLSTPVAVFGAFFILWLRRLLLGLLRASRIWSRSKATSTPKSDW